jgi:GTPase SAR1 family protein
MGGICGRSRQVPQALLLGLEGAGKSVFLEADSISSHSSVTSTIGYKTAKIEVGPFSIQVWDVGGKEPLVPLWPAFYRNVIYTAVIFVIDVEDETKFARARRELLLLTNEEELRDAIFVIVLNVKTAKETKVLEYYKEALQLNLIHPSVKHEAFLVDVKGKSRQYKAAMNYLEQQLAIRLTRKERKASKANPPGEQA